MGSVTIPLLQVTIVGPDLPEVRQHLDRRISVCWCGRPLAHTVWRCVACGWVPPIFRGRERELLALQSADQELEALVPGAILTHLLR